MDRIRPKSISVFDLVVVLIYAGTTYFLIRYVSAVDIKDHNLILEAYLSNGFFPIPPGYYSLVYLLDLLIRVKYPFVASSLIVITLFSWWKYRLLYIWLYEKYELNVWLIFGITLSFLFLSPIYIPAIDGTLWYLGKFTQMIWHNSTLICVFPFCLLLVQRTFLWLKSTAKTDIFFLFLWGVIILLIKPSFLFCYIPALPLFVAVKDRRFSKRLLQSLGLSIVLLLLIFIEAKLVFFWDPMLETLYGTEEQSKIVVKPFYVWLNYSKEPLFDFISSFPLVLAALIIWKKELFKSDFFSFSFLLLIGALAVFFIFAESGFREMDGNFYWQIPISLFLVHLSVLFFGMDEYKANGWVLTLRLKSLLLIYSIQVLCGVGYWLRIFVEQTLN